MRGVTTLSQIVSIAPGARGALNVRNSFRYKKRVLEYALVRGEVRRASFVRRKYRLDTVLHLN